jgi:NTP pyrophosphatase (non-canonical NTP hydrolase)
MNTFKDETKVLCHEKGWDKANINTVWLLFTEEIGELASAIRHRQKHFRKNTKRSSDIVYEMGDVFSYLFQLAYMLDIDLDEMWSVHREKVSQKQYTHWGL